MAGESGQNPTNSSSSQSWFWEGLDGYLAEKGLKQTRQRRIVVEIFLKMDNHIAAEDLHDRVRSKGHNIGLATIYRTLNLLVDAGLVDQKQFGENKAVYELHTPGEHHDHLICVKCGDVIEFENDEIEMLQEKVAKKHKFKLISHRLDLFGYCPACR